MNLEGALRLAREERLYPAVILHGGDGPGRQASALALGATLLCSAPPASRPCRACAHCRRIVWPGEGAAQFHPDFLVLERDLRTVTSVEATRTWLRSVQLAPYEAAGQVFVVASAETLSGEAANALLKALEEPPGGAPRHFLLLAPSQYDLLATLRSRSLAVYLGAPADLDRDRVEELAGELGAALEAWAASRAAIHLLAAAGVLGRVGGWEDPRAQTPWSVAAAAVVAALERPLPAALRRPLLELAAELLEGPRLRLRGIPAQRILEGLLSRHLGAAGRG